MVEFLSQAFTTLLVIIDPFAVMPVFMSLTARMSSEMQRTIAIRATTISLIVLLCFAFLGDKLLDTLGISEPAFRIAGGFLLLLAAIEMVVSRQISMQSTSEDETEDAKARGDVSVFPLAIPIIAGPGAMTSIVVLMRKAEIMGVAAMAGVIGSMIGVLIVILVMLLLSQRCFSFLGLTGMNVLTRIFGIILAALAVQFIINGTAMVVKIYF